MQVSIVAFNHSPSLKFHVSFKWKHNQAFAFQKALFAQAHWIINKHKSQLHDFNDGVSRWRKNIRAFASEPEATAKAKSEEQEKAEEKHKQGQNDTPQNFFPPRAFFKNENPEH